MKRVLRVISGPGRASLLLPAVLLLFLPIYWLKCQLGWNISGGYSLSKAWPFKYLQRDNVIAAHYRGKLLSETFDAKIIRNDWYLWMREQKRVAWQYTGEGVSGSNCLLITSTSDRDWFYVYTKFVKVRKGDSFRLCAKANISGQSAKGSIRIAAFDQNKKPINWVYVEAQTPLHNKWVELAKRFVITQDVHYIELGVAGEARGSFRFDDVALILEGQEDENASLLLVDSWPGRIANGTFEELR